jgi:hypothetical protein
VSGSGIEHEIHREIRKLSERDFRTLIVNYFSNQDGVNAEDRHGRDERGLDIEVKIEAEEDIIRRPTVIFIQVKAGDVGLHEWRENLCAQLSSLIYRRPINNVHDSLMSKRLLFITSGKISTQLHEEIRDWNKSMPILYESFEGREFARLLNQYPYKPSEVQNLLVRPADQETDREPVHRIG